MRRSLARGAFLAAAAAVPASIAIARFPAGAAEFAYKLGLNQPDTHPQSVRAKEATAKIRDETNGWVDIQVFPNSLLGGDTQMLAQLRSGALEFAQMADAILANVVPMAGLDGVGFAYSSYKEAWAAADGQVGSIIRAAIADAGMYAFETTWDAGFKQMSNSQRPIAGPADLKGLKFRIAAAPMMVALYKALEAAPVAMNLNELYTSLQTHLVDGADIGLTLFESGKYYEVQKHLAITNHSWTPFSLLANRDAWMKLPANLRDVVERNLNEAGKKERDDIARLSKSLQETVKSQGTELTVPPIEGFRAEVRKAGLYATWRDQFGKPAWTALEKYSGPLS